MKKRDVILEVQSMLGQGNLPPGKWQVAKDLVAHASSPPDTWKKIGPSGADRGRRPMIQQEAARIVAEAVRRIEAADAPD